MFAIKWDPTQFKLDINLQMYQETDGSLAYLKGHTVRKLVSLMKYMSLLITQDRPNAHKHNLMYFISGNQLLKLTAHDMKSALANEKLDYHGSQKFSSKRVKVINPKTTDTPSKVPTSIQTSGTNPNDTPITVSTTIQISVIKKGIKPDELPQFMAQHNCEGQDPTDDPSAVPTALQASCAHNPIDIPVQWFKFIHPSPKSRMTKTPFQIAVHVAYSPIASMNYKWTINLHDGYPLFQVMKQERYIPPSLHTLSNHKLIVFHLGDGYLCTSKILVPPGDNGESLEAANEEDEINDDLYKHKAQKGHQRPPRLHIPI